ncbi:MAG TPA: cytochrome c peroxidase, partial [Phycisphaerales bacterium]|nr:cytochrome c peroxidase [Phycisphaerales bacterium]
QSAFAQMNPVPVPSENPITEPKRVLGKILFWDEQVSSDNTVSCATCHSPGRGGTEPRLVRSPGPDGQLNTADDIFGSGGVVKSDANYDYVQDAVFGIKPQQTGRSANPTINAAYFFDLFWDGRATSQFTDPQTGQVAIASGGALESQAVGPPVSSVEMAHPNWNWDDITAKLAQVRPLDLATSPQPDVAAAIAAHPTYPELFAAAFGDPAITSKRVAFAIATYERTLVSDQTPWDAYIGGDTNAMTPTQVLGWDKFQTNGRCIECHMDPLFTDFTYRNIGARPIIEDTGRQAITGNPDHAGQFKVPGLRNTGLKRTYMHNGMFQNLGQVMAFYRQLPSAPPVFPENMDPLMNAIFLTSEESSAIQDFVGNALTDPRVANEQFPFDRLTLHIDRAADKASVLAGSGSPGTGGVVPAIIVQSPPMVGNDTFRVGLANALGNAQAALGVSTTPPVAGRITPDTYLGTMYAGANGMATMHLPLLASQFTGGTVLYVQWFVTDPSGAGGVAASQVGRLPIFCGLSGCPSACDDIDFNNDGLFPDVLDIADFLTVFAGGVCDGQQPGDTPCNTDIDFNNDTLFPDTTDIQSFISVFGGGPCV